MWRSTGCRVREIHVLRFYGSGGIDSVCAFLYMSRGYVCVCR